METRLAKLLSIFLHPLLMPTYGFLLLFFTSNYISTFIPIHIKLVILGVTFVFTFILPAINAFILLKMGRIKSLEMENPTERIIPYASTALYYFALFYLFYNAEQFPAIFKIMILGAAVSILLTLLINFKWKISAHTIGIGGIAGAALGIMYRLQIDLHSIFILILFFAGLVGYARLKLDAHSPAQVYTGFGVGLVVELALMLLY
jgi:Na+-transporting methylmalonyl-CoA/oxaloacetate decarboxylase gamma subunit